MILSQNYWVKNVDFDYNYPDFYDEKNYEYIDGEEVDKIQLNMESNRKISDEEFKFNFKPLDYDSYEFDDVGILNFNKPPTKSLSQKTISKRRFRPFGGDLSLLLCSYVRCEIVTIYSSEKTCGSSCGEKKETQSILLRSGEDKAEGWYQSLPPEHGLRL